MLECSQCGCKDELAVGLIWTGEQKAQVVCLACEAMYDLPEDEYSRYVMLIESAKQRYVERNWVIPQQAQDATINNLLEIEESDLPF